MKLPILLWIVFLSTSVFSQKISCQEAYEIVLNYGENKRTINIVNSSMLTKVIKYEIDNSLYVVGYIKSNEYDYRGKPYLFCGISKFNWNQFTLNYLSSAGEAFHKYIFPYKCDCY